MDGKIPCKFCKEFVDLVPMPFGSGNCQMPGMECTYDGGAELPADCPEDSTCPGYKPVEIHMRKA